MVGDFLMHTCAGPAGHCTQEHDVKLTEKDRRAERHGGRRRQGPGIKVETAQRGNQSFKLTKMEFQICPHSVDRPNKSTYMAL